MKQLHRTPNGPGNDAGPRPDAPEAPLPPRRRGIGVAWWIGACILSLLIWLGLAVAVGALLD